jgi:hypothetical protein
MSTDIDSLPDSKFLDNQLPKSLNMEPMVESNITATMKPVESLPIQNSGNGSGVGKVDGFGYKFLEFKNTLLSTEFALLFILLLCADNKYVSNTLHTLVYKYVPIDFVRNNNFLITLLKVLLIGIVFVLARMYLE